MDYRRTFLLSINTLACGKTVIQPMLRNIDFSYIMLNRSGVNVYLYLEEHNRIILTAKHVPKLNIEPKIQKIILHLHFTKSIKRENVYKLCL